MKWSKFVEEISKKTGYPKKQVREIVNAAFDGIIEGVGKGEKVSITGFGTFEPVERPAKFVKDVRSGEMREIEPTKSVKFKTGKRLKEAMRA